MPLFKVVVHGRGHWISLDDEMERVGFRVTRVVDAADADRAARKALELVGNDPKSRPEPGHPAATLTVDDVAPAAALPDPQPGFAFYPDPE
ncbi:MAG: hypothetical protein OEO20_13510 [Gemmatimonadota bacterium]|nr:hypothetical protein [Gemmatimonadota bacterium]MDH3367202.1 hypothetical protein [Gemmatimonadota bacterium]MDH3479310.1 hypothetical protein [Gemmatimonadota bacterium]MDH5548841.1 hypothetical protein [Gemmatimonadota bacterium]